MGNSSGSSSNQFGFQNSTSTTTPDPNAYNAANQGLAYAANVAAQPYQSYGGPLVAGFNQDQLAAQQGYRQAMGAVDAYNQAAANYAQQAAAYSSPSNFSQAAVSQYLNPLMNEAITNLPISYSQQAVAQYYDPRLQRYLDTAPLTYSPNAVQQYYNPYQQQVIEATKAGIEQQNAQQMAQQQAQAIQAGAFGGDRTGAARALLAGQQSLAQNQTLGALRQQGYQNALNAFLAQQQQALGVAQQQQQAAQSMFANQQGLGLNARQQAYNQALAQYNQQQQTAMAGANAAYQNMSNLGNLAQAQNYQQLQALGASGAQQQALAQQQYNTNYNKWLAAQAYPGATTANYAATIAALAPILGGTTNTTGYGYNLGNTAQSGGSSLGQIGGLATSLLGLFGSFSDERAKTNIDYVGKDPKTGDKLYAYDYKSDIARSEETGEPMPPKRISPMAQEVAEKNPDDVIDLGGLLGVKPDRLRKARGGDADNLSIFEDQGSLGQYWGDKIDPTNPFQMSKVAPYGGISNPKMVGLTDIPIAREDFPKTQDLGFIPGLPGRATSGGGGGGGGSGGLSSLSEGLSKLKKGRAGGSGAGLSSLFKPKEDVMASDEEFPASKSEEVPTPPKRPDDLTPASSLGLGDIGGFFKGLFNDGGRVGFADGGAPVKSSSNLDVGSLITLPGTGGQITLDQFNKGFNPVGIEQSLKNLKLPSKIGINALEAFGREGLGFDMPPSLAGFKMPWKNVNRGSSAYNNLLLQAAMNVGPRQLTPQEYGLEPIATPGAIQSLRQNLPSVGQIQNPNRSTKNAASGAMEGAMGAAGLGGIGGAGGLFGPALAGASANQANAVGGANVPGQEENARQRQLTLSTPRQPLDYFYENTYELTPEGLYQMVPIAPYYAANFKDGGAVKERYPLSAQYLDEPEQDLGSLAQGIYPAVKEVAFGNPRPGMHVMQEKSLGFGPVQMSHGGRAGYEDGGAPEEDTDIDRYLSALAKGESGGHKDPYAVIGPKSRKGDQPYGKYQVMGANVPSWSEEAGLGRLTPQEFLANPEAQEAVVRHKFGEYLKKTGSPEKAAAMWFGGPGYASHMGARDVLGTSIPQYMSRFSANAGRPGGTVVATDRGDDTSGVDTGLISNAGASGDAAPVISASDSGEGLGLFGMKPFMNPDLAMYLMSTGAGMMASRNRQPLGALGEGMLQGVEALQASRAGRGADAYHAAQVQNIQSEIAKRNAETEELRRRIAARRRILGGTPEGGEPISSDALVTPPAAAPMISAPEAPKVSEGEVAQPQPQPSKGAEETQVSPTPKVATNIDPIDTEIARASSDEKKFSLMSQRLLSEGLDAEAAKFEKLATDAANNRKTLMQEKRKSLTEKVDESSPVGQYRSATSGDLSDFRSTLDEAKSIIGNENVKFGPMASTIAKGKTLGKELSEEFLPEGWRPDIDTSSASLIERLGAIGKQATLDKLGGKLGAGISNADVTFMMDTDFNPEKSRAFNEMVLAKKEAALAKKAAFKEEALRYKQTYGINANFADHMTEWGDKHPIQSFMRKEAERKVGDIGSKEKPVASDRKIVKRGKSGDRPVVQYEDGTIEYAD